MEIISSTGREDLSLVYLARTANGKLIEFAESLQPPKTREEKWVLIVSTLYGCPVQCMMCDAGLTYEGRISKEGLFSQIDYLVSKRYPDRTILSKQFKIQFARMGEPTFNMNVLEVIEELHFYFIAPGFVPSISTIAPLSTSGFFERMLSVKNEKFSNGKFQLQFSIHTTDEKLRDELLPVKKMGFKEISKYGEAFYREGDRKITLNFAAMNEYPVEPKMLLDYFNPDIFLIKLTPLNPTYKSLKSNLTSYIKDDFNKSDLPIAEEFKRCGYEVIISIGELEENQIGSNCGQYITTHVNSENKRDDCYAYNLTELNNS